MATESKFGLFSDVFLVTNKNPDDKKFDRVDRILAEGEETEIILTLDVNTEIYPIESDDRYTFLLASSLALDDDHNMTDGGSSRMAWRKNISSAANGREEPPTLADAYDYVMYGKVYNFDDEDTKA
ncbi:hypothetical protein HK097_001838 [Rhizophlyctis rosea]|uniref:DNA-directed RNA polymerases I, II, and III subunit RPABC3 n=1 Tax=Rhizophlyctis rosea TaxID=64517 RepID=A0AAD5SJ41_9FUNG|nr:hypothetical protein HK097_001838 [Rhizophlyctis rosea]